MTLSYLQDPRLEVLKAKRPAGLIGPDGEHWELEEIEALPGYLEKHLPQGSIVFANNGMGDNLFLEPESSAVMVYRHEGSEIGEYTSHPKELLADRRRPPSEHGAVFYSEKTHGDRVQVLVGDHVEIKLWLFFWKGWQSARIYYVPGLSPKNPSLEYGGLAWVAVHEDSGGQSGVIVDPESNQLRHTVRFIRRSTDELMSTPENYCFGD